MSNDITRRRLLSSTGLLAATGLLGSGGSLASPVDAANDRAVQEGLPLRWSRVYSGGTYNNSVSLLERDDNYYALGATGDQASATSGWLFAVDATTGEGQWQTTVANEDITGQTSFQQLLGADDDGLVMLGRNLSAQDVSFVRTGPEGEIDWWRRYQGPETGAESGPALISADVISSGDGYVIGGVERADNSLDAVALDVDADGAEQSRTRFFEDDQSQLTSLVPAGDGGFVGTGFLQTQSDGSSQAPARGAFFRVDADRSVQWSQEVTASSDGEPFQINQLNDVVATDDGYVGVGFAAPQSLSSISGWVVFVDGSGTVQQNRTLEFQPATLFTGVTYDADGVTVAGTTAQSATSQTSSAVVSELDGSGEPRWNRKLSRADASNLQGVITTSDDGVLATGVAQHNSQSANPRTQAWLVKLGGAEAPSVTTSAPGSETTTASPTATPTPSPTPTPTPTPTLTPTAAATAVPSETAADATTTGDGPGFGIGTALAAIGASALFRCGGRGGDGDGG